MSSETDLLRRDTAAREVALDITRSFIVQAPAGSGKTELLIQRYLRLLSGVEEPEEVLAITFTRKAAAEMQLRVLAAIERTARGAGAGLPHEQVTLDAAADVLRVDRRRDWRLTENPHRLRIQTLDSLNASIVRAQPLTASAGTAVSTVASESETRRLYAEAAVLTLDQLLESGALREATERVLGHLDDNTDLYVAYLARMLATRDQWLPFVGSGRLDADEAARLRNRFESGLANAVGGHLDRLAATSPAWVDRELLPAGRTAAAALLAAGKADHPVVALREVEDTAGAGPAGWRAVAELLLTATGAARKTVDKRLGLAGGTPERDAVLGLLPQLGEVPGFTRYLHETRDLPPPRYTEEQWAVLLALFRLLPLAVTELKRLFGTRGVTDYTEVALGAADALGTAEDPGDIALLLDYQLRHVLVDEMQDTSSAQYRMLEALTGGWEPGDGRTLFCVGDPMQSIYRFRNAEVGQFLAARNTGIGNVALEPLTLRRNFRSGAGLVDWFNATFPTVLAAADDPARGAVAYAAAAAVREAGESGSVTVHPVFGSRTAAEAAAACQALADVLAADPEGDVAILVRSRTQLPELLAALRRESIGYRAVDIDRLTDLPEIIDLLALTRALVHRGDRLAWLALLRAPWAGLDWHDLHALVAGDVERTVWELMADEQRVDRLSAEGRAALARVRDRLCGELRPQPDESLRARVERLWLGLGGPGPLTAPHEFENVYRFLDTLAGFESGGTIPDITALEEMLDIERVSMSADAQVQVMTMHRAKGLQFEHVVLYGLGRTAARTERRVLSWFDVPEGRGEVEKIISPVGPRAEVESDPIHRFIERSLAARDSEESARLLYVACTRARRSLQLVGHVGLAADGSTFRPPASNSLLAMLWPAVRPAYEAAFRPVPAETAEAPAAFRQPLLKRHAAPWQVPVPGMLPGTDPPPDAPTDERRVDYDWVGSAARHAGTVVHRWLQLAGSGRVSLPELDAQTLAGDSRRWLLEAGVAPDQAGPIVERVVAAVEATARDPRGRWLVAGEGLSEYALTGIYRGRIESVVLDRVRVDDDGTHWIVDYKTGTHEGGGRDAFLAAEVERYGPQLARYRALYQAVCRAPVRCALYYPLLGAFVELPASAGATESD